MLISLKFLDFVSRFCFLLIADALEIVFCHCLVLYISFGCLCYFIGVSRLMDLLADNREVVRNDVRKVS